MGTLKNLAPDHEKPEIDLETRNRIFEAARDLFTTRGFKGVSMRDMAEVVKVTPAALYYHFPAGKTDLFIGVVKSIFDKQALAAAAAVEPGRDTSEKLRLLATHVLTSFRHNKEDFWHMLMRDVHLYLPAAQQPEIWKHYGTSYVRALREIFQEGMDKGELSASISADALTAMFHEMTTSFNWNPRFRECLHDPVEIGRMADTVVTVFLNGVAVKKS